MSVAHIIIAVLCLACAGLIACAAPIAAKQGEPGMSDLVIGVGASFVSVLVAAAVVLLGWI